MLILTFDPRIFTQIGDIQRRFFLAKSRFLIHGVCIAMFSFFKRPTKVQSENDFSDTLPLDVPAPAKSVARPMRPGPPAAMEALALEVQEGNDDADWNAWQDSVTFQDSQSHPELPRTKPSRQTHPNAQDEPNNAFDSVRKYSG